MEHQAWTIKYVALFVGIQALSLILSFMGIFICAALAVTRSWTLDQNGRPQWKGGRLTWIFGNLEDGIVMPGAALTPWAAFYWSAIRNSCNNLRYVPGVSGVGRPLFRKTWGTRPGGWYVSLGWNNSGYPVMSAGRNVNAY